MAKTIDETTCTVCTARLERHWNSAGTDFTWLDDSGRRCAGEGGPDGVDSAEDYLDWLRIHDISGYSAFLAHVTLGTGILPWQHWHRPAPVAVLYERGESLPWCCGEPAQLIRDGWLCREDPRHRLNSTT